MKPLTNDGALHRLSIFPQPFRRRSARGEQAPFHLLWLQGHSYLRAAAGPRLPQAISDNCELVHNRVTYDFGHRIAEDALKELLKKKQSGEKIEAPRERAPAKVINLMDALRRSVESERGGGEKTERRAAARERPLKKGARSSARQKRAG